MPKPIYEDYIKEALESPTGCKTVSCGDSAQARNVAQGLGMVRRTKGYNVEIMQRGEKVIIKVR